MLISKPVKKFEKYAHKKVININVTVIYVLFYFLQILKLNATKTAHTVKSKQVFCKHG